MRHLYNFLGLDECARLVLHSLNWYKTLEGCFVDAKEEITSGLSLSLLTPAALKPKEELFVKELPASAKIN